MSSSSQALILKQTTTISPQQIQFIKLLQLQTTELQKRVDEELQSNPALEQLNEEGEDYSQASEDYEIDNDSKPLTASEADEGEDFDDSDSRIDREIDQGSNFESDIDDVREIREETYESSDYAGLTLEGDGTFQIEEDKNDRPIKADDTLEQQLIEQLGFLHLEEKRHTIGLHLIGSLDDDGYIRRSMEAISDDLAFGQNLVVDVAEIEEVLLMIQKFDPAGIAARTLQECLLLQLERKPDDTPFKTHATEIVKSFFEEFTRKHYDKIISKLGIDEPLLKQIINLITHLNPKPGGWGTNSVANAVIPDFTVQYKDFNLELSLNSKNAPELRVNPDYQEMLKEYGRNTDKRIKKEASTWVRQKIDSANWFIEAIKQRQKTLMLTMAAIMNYQEEFFKSGDESKLRPMILKDIADRINMDISTVSRVANSKYVQTDYGTLPVKFFFSEGINTQSGEEVSNKEVKSIIKDLIIEEDKKNPLSDDRLVAILNEKGYEIARRTVAKYRESLEIPIARLRREL